MFIKTLVLKRGNKKVSISLQQRKTVEQLKAIERIANHFKMPVHQIRYK